MQINALPVCLIDFISHSHSFMSAFTFDFDLEDDLDESFDAIPLQESATLALEHELRTTSTDISAEEIPLSALVRTLSLLPTFSCFFFLLFFLAPRLMYGRQRSSPRSPRRSRTLP
jgi:hypothetical protein